MNKRAVRQLSLARNQVASGKRGRAKIPSPHPPFLFARPSRIYLKSFQEFCSKIVRASSKTHHQEKNTMLKMVFFSWKNWELHQGKGSGKREFPRCGKH